MVVNFDMPWISHPVCIHIQGRKQADFSSLVEDPFECHTHASHPQLLCRVKDSSQLLQKRLTQERNQEQKDRDVHTLATYKVFSASRRKRASHKVTNEMCLIVARACVTPGVPLLDVRDPAGGAGSRSVLPLLLDFPASAGPAGPAVHLQHRYCSRSHSNPTDPRTSLLSSSWCIT